MTMRAPLILQSDLLYYPEYCDRRTQEKLLEDLRAVLKAAPLYAPKTPRWGKDFSVRMTNCGALGWVSDISGYRYQATHPVTQNPWPPIPPLLLALWSALCDAPAPEACLVNYYGPQARMGLHQDKDEQDFVAPVISVSLGASCLFRYGGVLRKDPTQSVRLNSGDVLVLGGPSRLCFHGVDRLYPKTSTLVKDDARINMTLRRVTKFLG